MRAAQRIACIRPSNSITRCRYHNTIVISARRQHVRQLATSTTSTSKDNQSLNNANQSASTVNQSNNQSSRSNINQTKNQSEHVNQSASSQQPNDSSHKSNQHDNSSSSESNKQAQQATAHSMAAAAAQSHAYVVAADLTENFMRALHLSEQTRFVKGLVLGLSVLGIAGLFVWINRDNVKTSTAEQVADVAKRSLNSAEIQDQVNLLSQEVVHRLLTDPAVLNTALQFTTRLLHEPSTQTALSNLVGATLNNPETLVQAKEFSTRLVQSLSASPDVQATVAELVKQAINQPSNQQALIDLMRSVVNAPESKAILAATGSSSAHDVFNDPAVLEKATEFMKSVLADPTMQQQASDALWGAVRMTFNPKSIWGHGHHHHVKPPVVNTTTATPEPALATVTPPISLDKPVELDKLALAKTEVQPDLSNVNITTEPEVPADVIEALSMVAADLLPADIDDSQLLPTQPIVGTDVMAAINDRIAASENTSANQQIISPSSLAPTFHIVVSPVQPQPL